MVTKKLWIAGTILIFFIAACQRPPEDAVVVEGEISEEELARLEAEGIPQEEIDRPAGKEQIFAVITTPVQEGVLIDYMELSGDIQSTSSVDVLAETSGELARIFVDVGAKVRKNALLLRIDPSRPGQRFEVNDISAPIAGTVISLPLKVGSQVSPGISVAQVAKTDELEIVTSIAERFVSRVALGQDAVVTLDAYPGDQFSAEVRSISPVLNERTRTLELKLDIQDPEGKLRIGMFASLQLILERKSNTLQIPSDAIVRRFGRELTYVVDADRTSVEERVVKVGLEIDEKVEVLEGLEAGEEIVYQGQTFLTDGAKIQIIDTASPIIFED